jgi:hypothetical protein
MFYTDPNGKHPCTGQWINWENPCVDGSGDYDPGIPPEGVNIWGPNVNLSSQLVENVLGAQFNPIDEKGNLLEMGGKLCGQIAVEMILETISGSKYRLTDVYNALEKKRNKTGPYELAIAAALTFPPDWYMIGHDIEWSLSVSSNDSRDMLIDALAHPWNFGEKTGNWVADLTMDGLLYGLHKQLYFNKYTILLTSCNAGTGILVHRSTGVGHWVVFTGMTLDWDWSNPESKENWIRVNNPFNNREEYYQWSDFRESVSSPRYMVEIFRY